MKKYFYQSNSIRAVLNHVANWSLGTPAIAAPGGHCSDVGNIELKFESSGTGRFFHHRLLSTLSAYRRLFLPFALKQPPCIFGVVSAVV